MDMIMLHIIIYYMLHVIIHYKDKIWINVQCCEIFKHNTANTLKVMWLKYTKKPSRGYLKKFDR